jgi:replicative DNA helicase
MIPKNVDIEAEQAVLGSLIIDNSWCDDIFEILQPEDFYSTQNQKIYRAMKTLKKEGQPIDIVTIPAKESSIHASNIAEIATSVPSASHCVSYASQVRELSDRRKIVRMGQILASMPSSAKMMDCIKETLNGISKPEKGMTMKDIAQEYVANMMEIMDGKQRPSILSGISNIDKYIGGYEAGSLNIISARPGIGKSAMAGNMAYNMAKEGHKVLFISIEMTEKEVFTRLLSRETGIHNFRLKKGNVMEHELDKIGRGCDNLNMDNLTIKFTSNNTIDSLRALIGRKDRTDGLDIVFIDYLQLIKGSSYNRSNRVAEISEITRELKIMAGDYRVSIVLLSQLSREGAKGVPSLHHLRDSGSIEQDADTVAFLYEDDAGYAMLIRKNRHGEIGDAELDFNKATQTFTNKL